MSQKTKTSLERFFDSLLDKEKKLLQEYISEESYESLSKKFDQMIFENETK